MLLKLSLLQACLFLNEKQHVMFAVYICISSVYDIYFTIVMITSHHCMLSWFDSVWVCIPRSCSVLDMGGKRKKWRERTISRVLL